MGLLLLRGRSDWIPAGYVPRLAGFRDQRGLPPRSQSLPFVPRRKEMEMETITTAIGTAITSLSTNIQTMIGTNLPALLGVAAIFIAIPAVWGLVKRFCR